MIESIHSEDPGFGVSQPRDSSHIGLPGWLHPALSENRAAAMFRGLNSLTAGWGELIASAQTTVSIYQEIPAGEIETLYDEEIAQPLICAARIFDAASQAPSGLNEVDRQELALEAAVAFGMYANFPSAYTCALRIDDSLKLQFPEAATIIGIAAPGMVQRLLSDPGLNQSSKQYLALLDLYLSTGEMEHIDSLRKALIERILNAQSSFEVGLLDCSRISLEQVIHLCAARTLREGSSNLPEAYLARLMSSSIRVFLPPQYKAIKYKKLLTGESNTIISLPTSTGKTLLGEMCLVSALGNRPGLVCYLAPYVALGNQVAQTLRDHLPGSYRVHALLGGYRTAEQLHPESHFEVIVATPERFDSLLRLNPGITRQLRCVICDEAHLIESDQRGVRLEGLITRINLLNRAEHKIRIVLLSAVVSNCKDLQRWIGAPEDAVIMDFWKPTARRLAIWRQGGKLTWYQGDDPVRRPGASSQTPLGSLDLPWPEPNIVPTQLFGGIKKSRPLVEANVAYLAQYLLGRYGGPILMICATKQGTRDAARAMAGKLPQRNLLPERTAALIWLIENHYPFLLPMCAMLARGVAFHNSSVPHQVRRIIEDLVRNKELRVITATTTLAEGVDLPFRFTILVDWLQWDADTQRPIPRLLFKNVAGRCGRAGVFTEGDTIVYDNPLGNLQYTWHHVREANLEKTFLSEGAEPLQSAIGRAMADTHDTALDTVVAAQFLAAVPENPGSEDLPGSFAHETFAAYTLPGRSHLEEALRTMTASMLDPRMGALAMSNSPLKLTAFGEAVNRTGFSPGSCRRITEFMASLLKAFPDITISSFCAQALQSLGDLPEQSNRDLRKVLSKPSSHFPVKLGDLEEVIKGWLHGDPLQDIFARLPSTRRSSISPTVEVWQAGLERPSSWDEKFDKFLDFANGVLENFLPWLLSACEALSQSAGGPAERVHWANWAEMMERGVDSLWAATVLRTGAPGGRTSAALVGRNWTHDYPKASDGIGTLLLREEASRQTIEGVFLRSLDEVGGAQTPLGHDVLQLQQWFWGRAGLTLTRFG